MNEQLVPERRYSPTVLTKPKLPNDGVCTKCGGRGLYHDYDPHNRHNGYTCLYCGCEQVLANGTVSLIPSVRTPKARASFAN